MAFILHRRCGPPGASWQRPIFRRLLCFLPLVLLFYPGLVYPGVVSSDEGGAGQGRPLSLREAIDLARENDAALRKADLAAADAARSHRQSWGLFLPSATLQGGTSYTRDLFFDSEARRDPRWSPTSSLGVSLQLSPDIAPQIALREVAQERAFLDRDITYIDLVAQVRRRYYGLIHLQDRLQLLAEDIQLAEQQARQTRTRYENGLVSQRDLLQAELAVERARLNYRQGQTDFQLAQVRLLVLLGLEGYDPDDAGNLVLVDSLELSLDRVVLPLVLERYPASRYDAAMQDLRLRAAELSRREEGLSSRAPSLNLSTSWNSTLDSPQTDSLRVGFSLSLPLDGWLAGSSRAERVARADLQLSQDRIDRDDRYRQYQVRVQELVTQVNNAVEQIEIALLQVDIAEQFYALTEEGFLRGTVERMELDRARRDLLDARISVASGRYQHGLAATDLAQAVGEVNPEALLQEITR
ncbi:Outer membrane protein TolC [Alkalispirochaeta americana]|uniref:Outer membrane protein TolC n=1 Tax=Alkalispirochaeta americana TaxID=159291 RepID=A0A1N6TN07_9SPIO|nr:TolC family protein [Alkalispirochaeta americana]SIQ54790.1 Outer membrane protein TolC [Alkalispirochaeta americana]